MRMIEVKGHRLLIWVSIVLLIGQWGCIPPGKGPLGPPTLAEQDRAKLGTIGLIAARFPPEAQLKGPTSGKDPGAGTGAAWGFFNCIVGGAEEGAGGLALGILASPLCALVGGAIGSSEASKTVTGTEITLNRAVVDLNIQEAIRDRLFQIMQQETRYPLVLLTEQVSSTQDAVVAGGSSARQETDTTLEVSIPVLGLVGGWFNSPVQLYVTAHARLVKVSDGTELYADQWTYWGGSRKFDEWEVYNARPLRTELERAVQTLAETIVEELFLVYRIPDVENKSQ